LALRCAAHLLDALPVFGDGPLGGEMAALTDNLRALRPDLQWGRGERGRGPRQLGYGEAASALEEIGELDDLMDQLAQEHPGATRSGERTSELQSRENLV